MEHGRQNLNLQLYFTTNNTDERKKNRQVDQTFLGLSIFCESVGNSRPLCHRYAWRQAAVLPPLRTLTAYAAVRLDDLNFPLFRGERGGLPHVMLMLSLYNYTFILSARAISVKLSSARYGRFCCVCVSGANLILFSFAETWIPALIQLITVLPMEDFYAAMSALS